MEEIEKDSGRDMTPRLIGETWRKYPTETSTQKATYGLFECQYCGKEFVGQTNAIKFKSTKSCGCVNFRITHGLTHHPLYGTWSSMVKRCTNPKDKGYKNYGGRGITVCAEWLAIKIFIEWAESTHPNIEGYTLDRIDNDKGYSPENCTWSDKTTQCINQRIMKNNKSGYVGVSYHSRDRVWTASVRVNYKKVHIGYYSTKKEAAQARDQYILENKLPHKLSTEYKRED